MTPQEKSWMREFETHLDKLGVNPRDEHIDMAEPLTRKTEGLTPEQTAEFVLSLIHRSIRVRMGSYI